MSSFSKRYFEDMKVENRLKSNGKGYKKVYVYCGDWYLWDIDKNKLKIYKLIFALSALISFALYVICGFQHVPFNYSAIFAFPMIISLFPMCYQIIGIGQFCFSKEKMMRIDFEDISKKLKFGPIVSAVFLIITGVTGITVMLLSNTAGVKSIFVLLGIFAAAVFSLLIFILQKKLKFKTQENKIAE